MLLYDLSMSRRLPGTLFLRNLLERRSLLFQLVRRDFEQRFVGSAMGWIWGLIHPLVLLFSWIYIFQIVMRVPMPQDAGTNSYALYIFAGMLPWLLFSDTVQRSASSLPDHANLITKTVFPAEIVPVSVFLSTLASHLLALALMIGAAAVWVNQISVFLVFLPVYMFLIGLFAVGVGWVVASLHVYLRDTAQVVSVILTLWFWMTPIMVPLPKGRIPGWAQAILSANPLLHGVRAYRQILLTSRFPDIGDVAILACSGAAAFLIGGLFFRYMKRGFADVL
jgi:lipopolysaccharide transport system permease protein